MPVEIMKQPPAAAEPAPTASQRIIQAATAGQMRSVVLQDGRKLVFKAELEALEDMRLCATLGPALADNEPYMRYARMAARLHSIDDEPVAKASRAQIENLIQRIGNVGVVAMVAELYPIPAEDSAEAAASPEETFPGAEGNGQAVR